MSDMLVASLIMAGGFIGALSLSEWGARRWTSKRDAG